MSDCALFMIMRCSLPLVLHYFFSTLVFVLASVVLRVATEYVLMEFIVLSLLTIYSNTGSSSE